MRVRTTWLAVMTTAAMLTGACSAAQRQATPLAPAGAVPSEDAPVIVYGTRWCQHTRAAMDYLRGRNIPVRFRDVDADGDAYDEMINRARAARVTTRGIPVLVVRDRVLIGFHTDEIDRALQD